MPQNAFSKHTACPPPPFSSLSRSLLELSSYRAKEVLRDLKSVHKSTDAAESYAMGFGLGFRVMGVKAGEYSNEMKRSS